MHAKLYAWASAIRRMSATNPTASRIVESYRAVFDFIVVADLQGGCHSTSAILTILLLEQGIDAVPCIGECGRGKQFFDHSWVEVEGEIYDVAIANPLPGGGNPEPPVFDGKVVTTGARPKTPYGVVSPVGFDAKTEAISRVPVVAYMDSFPGDRKGLLGVANSIGAMAGVKLNVSQARSRYAALRWAVRPES